MRELAAGFALGLFVVRCSDVCDPLASVLHSVHPFAASHRDFVEVARRFEHVGQVQHDQTLRLRKSVAWLNTHANIAHACSFAL